MTAALPPVLCLMGPTAAGKTGLAVHLCEQFPCDIISVDSALVYRRMAIGTAKPDATTLARAPHRLIDLLEPHESYSAAAFREDALREIEAITTAGRIPLLVGGTMLYFRALLQGLARLPEADPDTRKRIEARAAREGWPALHGELALRDPEVAARIDENDSQRIQRALEVMALTGQPLSALHAAQETTRFPYRVMKIVVCPAERRTLHERIAQRFDMMLEQGLVDEVRALHGDSALHAELPAMRAVGYRQLWGWLDGDYDEAEMRERALAATRQLAKRQLTWLRREPATLWYDPDTEEVSAGEPGKASKTIPDPSASTPSGTSVSGPSSAVKTPEPVGDHKGLVMRVEKFLESPASRS